MATTDTTIRFVRSQTYSFSLIVYQNNAVVNLSGATLYFTAKWRYSDPDASAVFQLTDGSGITVTSPSAGAVTVTIPDSATENLPYAEVNLAYDLLVVTSTGSRGFPLRGTLIISPNASRA